MTGRAIDPLDFSYLDRLHRLPVRDGRLYLGRCAQACRDRPALVFVHGGHMGAWAFSVYLRYFDGLGLPAAAVDCRGHGGLPQDPSFTSAGITDYADDVAAAAMHFAVPPILLGHSLGALTVGVAMGQCRISGLGLLAPSPPGQLPGASQVPMIPEDGCRTPPAHLSEASASSLFRDRLCAESPVALNDRYRLRVNSADPQGVPAVCIAAGLDDSERHPPGQDQAVGDFFGAKTYILPNAGHCFMITPDWRDSAALLAAWYDRTFRIAT